MKNVRLSVVAGALLSLLPAIASALTVDLSADSTLRAPNDLFKVDVFSEANGASPQEVARIVNQQIASAVALSKSYSSSVKVQTGGTHTYPVYGKNSRIAGWRMRSELQIESQDPVAFSELVGKLQTTLSVSDVQTMPAVATRKKFEGDATLGAIDAFKVKAAMIASSFNKPYRIKGLSFNGQYRARPMMEMVGRSKVMMMSDAAPMPVEAGESEITVNVTGQIEILD